jgi:hypothetical protein
MVLTRTNSMNRLRGTDLVKKKRKECVYLTVIEGRKKVVGGETRLLLPNQSFRLYLLYNQINGINFPRQDRKVKRCPPLYMPTIAPVKSPICIFIVPHYGAFHVVGGRVQA